VPETLKLSPTESVEVARSSADVLEVLGIYAPHGKPPPAHFHPSQDEHFEVLAGAINTRVDGAERTLGEGETIDIPRGTPHQMWNAGDVETRLRWRTKPGGRTHEWFSSIDRLHREGKVGRNGMPGVLAFAALLTEYKDVFRLAAKPAPLIRGALAALAPLGRARGYL
jgi:mannose-6-phosphate isomerase-like protein (cupin superfamily)